MPSARVTMKRLRCITMALLPFILTGGCSGVVPTVLVVNLIPLHQSAETDDNAEPTVAVKQPFPLHIAATAHNPGGSFCAEADRSAIFVSDDGGLNWSLRCIVERDPASFPADPILRFLNDDLYAAYLYKSDWAALTTTVRLAKASQFLIDPVMTAPFADWIDFDQPHLHTWAGSIAGGVGMAASDFSTVFETPITCHAGVVVAAVPPTGPWRRKCIAVRSGFGRHDGARVTTHVDGTTYAAYQRVVSFPAACIATFSCYEGDIVVLRGDPQHMATTPLSQLIEMPALGVVPRCAVGGDPGLGMRPARCRVFPNDGTFNVEFGQELRANPRIALAVAPSNSRRVYVAWADSVPGVLLRLHVSVSADGGESWTALPGAQVDNATNPALAVTANGHLGFLYQQVVDVAGSKYWHSRLVVTTDDFLTKKTYRLAETPAWLPPATLNPYLGDYTDLLAVDEMFFGVFSASNDRVHSSFPCGEVLQRKVVGSDLRDVSGTITIPPSIDPYFFTVTTQSGLPPEC